MVYFDLIWITGAGVVAGKDRVGGELRYRTFVDGKTPISQQILANQHRVLGIGQAMHIGSEKDRKHRKKQDQLDEVDDHHRWIAVRPRTVGAPLGASAFGF